ncbi:MAG: hypothetical protein KDC43_08560 [Saprospiraceae bacterium]|nr:hypothetical protein [Saprospiraceae bacterium]MCB0623946.1 hypothetical protein [Saprospiraceae bacterium]MCB0679449.1 hypothetical protein [Saprospiraceae bacterium]
MKFKLLEAELAPYRKVLGQAADAVIDQEVSEYPILVVHQQSVDIGLPLVDREAVRGKWSVNVSTLEEFVTKQLIAPDRIEPFTTVYKDPADHLCLFVLSELGATFVFLPRHDEEEKDG